MGIHFIHLQAHVHIAAVGGKSLTTFTLSFSLGLVSGKPMLVTQLCRATFCPSLPKPLF